MRQGGLRTQSRFDLRDLGGLEGPPDRDFDMAVALASRADRAPIATFAILDFQEGLSRIRAQTGLVDLGPHVFEMPIGSAMVLSAMSADDVVVIPHTGKNPRAMAYPMIRDHGIHSLLAAPVLCPAQEAVALLAVHDRIPPGLDRGRSGRRHRARPFLHGHPASRHAQDDRPAVARGGSPA